MSETELAGYIELYRPTVFRVALNYLKNYEDAEDISQDAFVKLYTCETQFSSSENVKAWLIRVTINLCKNQLRSMWHRSKCELPQDIPAPGEEYSELADCINKLRPEYASVIYLFYYEGYQVKEIATLCGMTSTAVRTRLSRGRRILKEMLPEGGTHNG